MAVFNLKFDTDNAALDDDRDGEIVRILHSVASQIEADGLSGFYETVRDINGNDIGRFSIKDDDGTNAD